jgi:uncharacterized protein YjbI with pentapeptide repeats
MMLRRQVLTVTIVLAAALLMLSACFQIEEETRTLTIEEYILLNQERPLWLVEIDLAGVDLRGIDFSGSDLRGANLRRTNLRNAKLTGANLLFADLSGADLSGADLREADLRGTNLSGTNMSNTNLTGAQFNSFTRWRADFDPIAAGAVVVE